METRCAKDATTSVHVSLVLCTGIIYYCIIYYLFLYSIMTLPMHAVTMFPYACCYSVGCYSVPPCCFNRECFYTFSTFYFFLPYERCYSSSWYCCTPLYYCNSCMGLRCFCILLMFTAVIYDYRPTYIFFAIQTLQYATLCLSIFVTKQYALSFRTILKNLATYRESWKAECLDPSRRQKLCPWQ